MTKICVFSDLHIGQAGKPANNFKFKDQIFSDYLLLQSNIYDLIILNGDVFELWEGVVETVLHAGIESIRKLTHERFETIKASYPKIVETIKKLSVEGKLVLINGNHDSLVRIDSDKLLPGMQVYENKTVTIGPYVIRFEHGHQGDAWCKEGSALSCISWFTTQFRSAIDDLVTTKLDESFDLLTESIDTSSDAIKIFAGKLGKAVSADVVVFGHTHIPLLDQLERGLLGRDSGVIYANSGKSCDSDDLIDQVSIYVEDKGVMVVEKRKASVKTAGVTIVQSIMCSKTWSES